MTISFDSGLDAGTAYVDQRDAAHPNPMFDYLTGFIPRKLKDLFKWSEFLSIQSAHIYATVKKFGEYPLTSLEYETTSEKEREQRKDLYEQRLHLRAFAGECSFDKFVYGNVFASLYKPFRRLLPCNSCKARANIRFVDYRFNLDKLLFTFRCPECAHESTTKAIDIKLSDPKRMSLRRWAPKDIDIDYNPVSGAADYYYSIPRDMVSDVRNGSRVLIDTMPIEFLEAMQQRRVFQFAPDSIYHMKMPGPSGLDGAWGIPPVTAAIRLFLFTAILRRANEAIALDHVAPFRVLFPQGGNGNGDPIGNTDLAKWKEQVTANWQRFRRDPLQIMTSPTPLGYQAVGGEGRALLTISEIQEADKATVLCFGVPIEFVVGGMGQLRGEQDLRQLENQLQSHVDDMNGLAQWVENDSAKFFNRRAIPVKFTPFKMLDDESRKGFVLQAWQMGKSSDTTAMKTFDMDPNQERRQRKEDAIADMRAQMETDRELTKLQDSLTNKAQQQAAASQQTGHLYDITAVMEKADQVAQQLLTLDPGSRRSQLDALGETDPVLEAVVAKRLQQSEQDTTQQMKAEARNGGAM